jgi:TonB-dependent starch-binding outer membrane protein SusC
MPLRVRFLILLTGMAVGLSVAMQAHAQATGTVEGRVLVERTQQPISGVQVTVEGQGLGALTDRNGRFSISSVPAGEHQVRAQRIGFGAVTLSVTVTSGGVAALEFTLTERAIDLEGLVVTGQGSEISRRRLSTNIDVISTDDITASPAGRLDQLLQASLPSVQVRLASGQPGSTSLMRGRGPVSASRGSTPVIYVDGVRVDNLNSQAELSLNTSGNRAQGTQTSSIADIPLENIERIEYIPGGAATTLYGSDAANGVIQIFTARGTPGTRQFTIESEIGLETPDKRYFHFPQTVDLLYRNGLSQRYRLSGQGGSEAVAWSFGASVQDREGFRVANNASRNYQARTGLSAAVTDDLTYDGSFSFGWNHYDRTRDGNAGSYTPLWLLEGARIFALGFNNQLDRASAAELEDLRQFLHRAEELQNFRVQAARFQTSQAMRWEPRADLSFRGLAGVDFRSSNERGIQTNEFLVHTRVFPEGTDDRGQIANYDRSFLGLTLEGGGQHRYDRGALSLITNVGGQLFRTDDQQAARLAFNVRDGSETVRGAGTTSADDVRLTVANYGVYAQQNWGFHDRYFVEVGLRADGNSAFGDDVGFQYYPKVGLVWDMGAEPFYQDTGMAGWISQLRLRANYGVAGNFPPPFTRDRTVNFASYLGRQAVEFGNPGNPLLKPEKTYTIEFGGDLEALDGRLGFQVNWYDARTRDALFEAPPAPSTGEGLQLRNVGEIQNSGLELRVHGEVVQRRELSVRMNASYNTLKNEVVSSGGTAVFPIGGHSAETIQSVVQEGFCLGALRGNRATFGPDGTIQSVEALSFLGCPLPERFGSLGADVRVGQNLRFNMTADWQTGARNQSFDRQFRYLYIGDDPALPAGVTSFPVGPEGLGGRAPLWLQMTDQFVEETDYLLVRNISATYVLPPTFAPGFATGVEVGVGIHNPIGWWKSSFDPETDYSGAMSQGGATVGGFNYAADPSPRTFLANVRVRF